MKLNLLMFILFFGLMIPLESNAQKKRKTNKPSFSNIGITLNVGSLIQGPDSQKRIKDRFGLGIYKEVKNKWIINLELSYARYDKTVTFAEYLQEDKSFKINLGKRFFKYIKILPYVSYLNRNFDVRPFVYPTQEYIDNVVKLGSDIQVELDIGSRFSIGLGMDNTLIEFGHYKHTNRSPIIPVSQQTTSTWENTFLGKESYAYLFISYKIK